MKGYKTRAPVLNFSVYFHSKFSYNVNYNIFVRSKNLHGDLCTCKFSGGANSLYITNRQLCLRLTHFVGRNDLLAALVPR